VLNEAEGEEMTRKKQLSSELPNMSQQALMQHLSLDNWKIASRLPIPVGELMLSCIREYGWIEIQGEKQNTAIRLTAAGLKAMQSPI
jgi:hypothetical protein